MRWFGKVQAATRRLIVVSTARPRARPRPRRRRSVSRDLVRGQVPAARRVATVAAGNPLLGVFPAHPGEFQAQALGREVGPTEYGRQVADQDILEFDFEILDGFAIAIRSHHLQLRLRNGLSAGAKLGEHRRRQIDQFADLDVAEFRALGGVAAAGRCGRALRL